MRQISARLLPVSRPSCPILQYLVHASKHKIPCPRGTNHAKHIHRTQPQMRKPAHPGKFLFVYRVIDCNNLKVMITVEKCKLDCQYLNLLMQDVLCPCQPKMCFLKIDRLRLIHKRVSSHNLSRKLGQQILICIPCRFLSFRRICRFAQIMPDQHSKKIIIRIHPLINPAVIPPHHLAQVRRIWILIGIDFLFLFIHLCNLLFLPPEIFSILFFSLLVPLLSPPLIVHIFYHGEKSRHPRACRRENQIDTSSCNQTDDERHRCHTKRGHNRHKEFFLLLFFFFIWEFYQDFFR